MVLRFKPEPLSDEAFAPYGSVIAHQGTQRRHFVPAVVDADLTTTRPMAWVSKMKAAVTLPLTIDTLERHLHSAQTFIPLSHTHYLIFVAGNQGDGRPDMHAARAFIAAPSQGVCFHRGTWHFGLSPLADDAEFFVVMSKAFSSAVQDDEFLPLSQTCCIEAV